MQNSNEAKVVKLTNIFDFDYTHAYDGTPYLLRAGSTQLFPWAIGDHLATHLARQAIIRKAPSRDDNSKDGRGGESMRSDRPLWDDVGIEELKKRIVQDAYTEERAPVMTESEAYKHKVEELNREYKPDPITPPATEVTISPETHLPVPAEPKVYQDKAEVIGELQKRGIAHNPRASKVNLEKLLV